MPADLGEQEPPRGDLFSPTTSQGSPEIRGRTLRCHSIAFRHDDEAHPTLDAATQLQGNLPDNWLRVFEGG
jgi:hypothetical protein